MPVTNSAEAPNNKGCCEWVSDSSPIRLRRLEHTLQRTAPAVTLTASGLRLAPTMQPARQPPQSLSLGSLGA